MSHHVTSYFFLLFLLLWCAVRVLVRVLRIPQHTREGPSNIAIATTLMCLAWVVYAAMIVISYLSEPIGNGFREFARLIAGEQKSRQLFRAEGGYVQPKWEQLVGFASVFAILGGLPFGAWGAWHRYRRDALALALAVGTLVYPATLALRFTTVGAELSSRALAFLFIAISFLLAVGLTYWWDAITGMVRGGMLVGYGAFIMVLFLGGIVTGYGPSVARLPGPYLVVADERSIEPQGLAAAAWALARLGSDHRIGADRINGVLMGTYGEQFPVTELASHIDLSPIFFSPTVNDDVIDVIKRTKMRYLVIDRRLSTGLPLYGFYIQPGENEGALRTVPVDLIALEKFDQMPQVSRVFDSGDISIYDMQAISNGQ